MLWWRDGFCRPIGDENINCHPGIFPWLPGAIKYFVLRYWNAFPRARDLVHDIWSLWPLRWKEVSQFYKILDKGEILLLLWHCFPYCTSPRELTLHSKRRHLIRRNLRFGLMLIYIPGVGAKGLLSTRLEYAMDVVVSKGRTRDHNNGWIIDNSETRTKTKLTDP